MTTVAIVVDGGCTNNNQLDQAKRHMYFSMAVLKDNKPVEYRDSLNRRFSSPHMYEPVCGADEVKTNNVAELYAMKEAFNYLNVLFVRTPKLSELAEVEIWTDSADVFGWMGNNKVKQAHLKDLVKYCKLIHELLVRQGCYHSIVLKPRAQIVAVLGH